MSPWQATREIRRILAALTWPSGVGAGTAVFGSVIASAAPVERVLGYNTAMPVAIVRPAAFTADKKHTGILRGDLEVVSVVQTQDTIADRDADVSLIGSATTRGLLEVTERVGSALERLDRADAVSLLLVSVGAASGIIQGALVRAGSDPTRVASRQIYNWLSQQFRAVLTRQNTYEPASGVTSVNLGGGSARVTWTDPPLRYDRVDVHVRRAAGATPPATAADGVLVANIAIGVQLVNDVPGVGQVSYSVFGRYDDNGDVVADQTSPSGPSSGTTVTVT